MKFDVQIQKLQNKCEKSNFRCSKKGDSLGGIIESVTTNLPVGLGEPIFGSLESDLGKALYSIPAVKGVEFGSGFEVLKHLVQKIMICMKLKKEKSQLKQIMREEFWEDSQMECQ